MLAGLLIKVSFIYLHGFKFNIFSYPTPLHSSGGSGDDTADQQPATMSTLNSSKCISEELIVTVLIWLQLIFEVAGKKCIEKTKLLVKIPNI